MLLLLLVSQLPLHLCWCAPPAPGPSGGGKTLQDTNARQIALVVLVRIQPILFNLSLPLSGREASPTLWWLSFKVQGVYVHVYV